MRATAVIQNRMRERKARAEGVPQLVNPQPNEGGKAGAAPGGAGAAAARPSSAGSKAGGKAGAPTAGLTAARASSGDFRVSGFVRGAVSGAVAGAGGDTSQTQQAPSPVRPPKATRASQPPAGTFDATTVALGQASGMGGAVGTSSSGGMMSWDTRPLGQAAGKSEFRVSGFVRGALQISIQDWLEEQGACAGDGWCGRGGKGGKGGVVTNEGRGDPKVWGHEIVTRLGGASSQIRSGGRRSGVEPNHPTTPLLTRRRVPPHYRPQLHRVKACGREARDCRRPAKAFKRRSHWPRVAARTA